MNQFDLNSSSQLDRILDRISRLATAIAMVGTLLLANSEAAATIEQFSANQIAQFNASEVETDRNEAIELAKLEKIQEAI